MLGDVRAPFLLSARVNLQIELVVHDLPNVWIAGAFIVLRCRPSAIAVILRREGFWITSKDVPVFRRREVPDGAIPEMVKLRLALDGLAFPEIRDRIVPADRGGLSMLAAKSATLLA
jgi:hypothetical protein